MDLIFLEQVEVFWNYFSAAGMSRSLRISFHVLDSWRRKVKANSSWRYYNWNSNISVKRITLTLIKMLTIRSTFQKKRISYSWHLCSQTWHKQEISLFSTCKKSQVVSQIVCNKWDWYLTTWQPQVNFLKSKPKDYSFYNGLQIIQLYPRTVHMFW